MLRESGVLELTLLILKQMQFKTHGHGQGMKESSRKSSSNTQQAMRICGQKLNIVMPLMYKILLLAVRRNSKSAGLIVDPSNDFLEFLLAELNLQH